VTTSGVGVEGCFQI